MTSMLDGDELDKDMNLTPIFTFSKIPEQQRDKPTNNKKSHITFEQTTRSTLDETGCTNNSIGSYTTTDTDEVDTSLLDRPTNPLARELDNRKDRKQIEDRVNVEIHTPPRNSEFQPVQHSTPSKPNGIPMGEKKTLLEQCQKYDMDTSSLEKYDLADNSLPYKTCEEEDIENHNHKIENEITFKGISKIKNGFKLQPFKTALLRHFTTIDFDEFTDTLHIAMPCIHSTGCPNKVMIHFIDGSHQIIGNWCHFCKEILQYYDTVDTVTEPYELLEFVGYVKPLPNNDKVIDKLLKLSNEWKPNTSESTV